MKIILDASAWIEYLDDAPHAATIEEYLQKNECFTLSITMAEVTAKTLLGGKDSEKAIIAMRALSRIIAAEEEVALNAAHIYARQRKTNSKFSLSDAFVVALAQKNEAKVLTKDRDFSGFKETILLK